jgi:hypothetical protein
VQIADSIKPDRLKGLSGLSSSAMFGTTRHLESKAGANTPLTTKPASNWKVTFQFANPELGAIAGALADKASCAAAKFIR